MKRFWILTKAMFLVYIRNRITLFWNMVFPIFMLVIYGLIFESAKIGEMSYLTWMIPGVVVLNILAYGLLSSSSMLVNMRENGVLLRLATTPVPAQELVGAFLIINILISLLQAMLIILTAAIFFNYSLDLPGLLKGLPMILLAIVTSVAMGQIISGVANKAGTAVALGQLFYFSQMFLTDMVIPVALMPEWLQEAARFLPGYTITQLVRTPLLSGELSGEVGLNLLLSSGYAAASATIAALLFRWAPRS